MPGVPATFPDCPPVEPFSEPLHVGRPNLGDWGAFLGRIEEIRERVWLTNDGPFVREFEARVAAVAEVKHCIAMCNATVALEIAIRAAGLSGEVIIPSFTFVATAHALQWQEITPVFCDIDPVTHTLDPQQIERLITPLTSAIIGVHLWGRGCQIAALEEIARRHELILLFDAAHAFGCTHEGRPIGGRGLAEVFSFHATKFLNSGEGGAVVTNNDELAARIRLMRNFGFAGYDNVIYVGTNGKMSELSAAMGLTSLDSINQFVQVNGENYQAYRRALAGLPGLSLRNYPEQERHNFQYIVVEVDDLICPLTRDQLVQILHAHNVLARRYFHPGVHHMEPYRSHEPNAHLRLPVTESVARRVLVLPTGTSVSTEQIGRIGEILRWACQNAGTLRTRFSETVAPGGSFVADE